MTANTVMIAVMSLAMGAMMAAFAWACARGDLPRNGLAGIRIPSTMASDAAWVAGHRAAVPWFWGSAGVAVAGGLAALVAGLAGAGEGVVVACGLGGIIGCTVPLLGGAVVASRAARRVG